MTPKVKLLVEVTIDADTLTEGVNTWDEISGNVMEILGSKVYRAEISYGDDEDGYECTEEEEKQAGQDFQNFVKEVCRKIAQAYGLKDEVKFDSEAESDHRPERDSLRESEGQEQGESKGVRSKARRQ